MRQNRGVVDLDRDNGQATKNHKTLNALSRLLVVLGPTAFSLGRSHLGLHDSASPHARSRLPCALPRMGLLDKQLKEKWREVKRMWDLPEAREDGSWSLKVSYVASSSDFSLDRALGYRSVRLPVISDLKRRSPGRRLGEYEKVHENMNIEFSIDSAIERGATAIMISTDRTFYGGSFDDLKTAAAHVKKMEAKLGREVPIIAKDIFVDPLQIGRAAVAGANAILLIAGTCSPDDFEKLLNACTIAGVQALVEVHTVAEVELAVEHGAHMFLINERDRETGELIPGTARSLTPWLPTDATILVGGGIQSIEEVRELRASGYDGVVIGRALVGSTGDNLMQQIAEEPWGADRSICEKIAVPIEVPDPDPDDAAATEAEAKIDHASKDF